MHGKIEFEMRKYALKDRVVPIDKKMREICLRFRGERLLHR